MLHALKSDLGNRGLRLAVIGVVSVAALAASGCSANITRFDKPFAAVGSEDAPRAEVRPSAPMQSRNSYGSDLQGTYGERTAFARPQPSAFERNSLPQVKPPPRTYETVSPGIARRKPQPIPSFDEPRSKAPVRREVPVLTSAGTKSGQSIVVAPGDTLYRLARRHGTSISALRMANGLNGSMIKPGQTLALPRAASMVKNGKTSGAAPQKVVVRKREPAKMLPSKVNWGGSYTVRSGDSLYNIARSKGVTVGELTRANGIADPRRLKPGAILKVPGNVRVAQAGPAIKSSVSRGSAPVVKSDETFDVGSDGPKVLNGTSNGSPRASIARTKVESPVRTAVSNKLKWPVVGRIVSPFGKRKDGSHNDGIDIAVPRGTDVRAANDGVIAYAGSEVKGFGNLLLVRHKDGMVTAYAHNDKLLVQRGDRVRRGQVVAKSGASGGVDRPQLHFELRSGSKPVNPVSYLERL